MNWANSFLKSPICQVEFLGFKSDTLSLARAGWSISAQQDFHYHGISIALKHEQARLYAISNSIDMHNILRLTQYSYISKEEATFNTTFQIKWVQTSPIIELIRQPSVQWGAVDPYPSFSNRERIDIKDLIPFKTIRPDAPEIVIAPESISELMEKIIKLQDPKQKEIRDRQRKEAWRDGQGSNSFNSYNPSTNIQAQIISLVG